MLISEDYRQMQRELHLTNPNYGIASLAYAPLVVKAMEQYDCWDVLDYGAGKQRLLGELKKGVRRPFSYTAYEPSDPEFCAPPVAHDLVCCIDVLEHIEPEYIGNVLEDLLRCTKRYLFLTVHTGPAEKVLPDGRNAHLTQQDVSWWAPKIQRFFSVVRFARSEALGCGFFMVAEPKE